MTAYGRHDIVDCRLGNIMYTVAPHPIYWGPNVKRHYSCYFWRNSDMTYTVYTFRSMSHRVVVKCVPRTTE